MIIGFVIAIILVAMVLALVVICGAGRYDKIRPDRLGPQALDDDGE